MLFQFDFERAQTQTRSIGQVVIGRWSHAHHTRRWLLHARRHLQDSQELSFGLGRGQGQQVRQISYQGESKTNNLFPHSDSSL